MAFFAFFNVSVACDFRGTSRSPLNLSIGCRLKLMAQRNSARRKIFLYAPKGQIPAHDLTLLQGVPGGSGLRNEPVP
jgi:hypothetical protein